MLAADKQALGRELRLNMLNIQWKELDYLYTNFQNLATCSSALVAFGIGSFGLGVSVHPESKDGGSIYNYLAQEVWTFKVIADILVESVFIATASIGVAWNLLALFIATTSSICGPGMALRGSEGSVGVSVRHLEAQLKRALRFFGRGIVAFSVSIVAIGLRNLTTSVSFMGGVVTSFVGLWVISQLWFYGGDIAEKFYVSHDRTVRGAFVEGPEGQEVWTNTADEVAHQVTVGRVICGIECGGWFRRWRPKGHGVTTPLWRLDKFISFPYHDDALLQQRLRSHSEAARTKGRDMVDMGAKSEQAQANKLVLAAQGPTSANGSGANVGSGSGSGGGSGSSGSGSGGSGSSSSRPTALPSPSRTEDFEASFSPLQALQMVGSALAGGASWNGDRSAGSPDDSSRPRYV